MYPSCVDSASLSSLCTHHVLTVLPSALCVPIMCWQCFLQLFVYPSCVDSASLSSLCTHHVLTVRSSAHQKRSNFIYSCFRAKYGNDNVVLSDIKKPDQLTLKEGPYVYSDVTDLNYMNSIVVDNAIDWVVHYSALLSAAAEDNVKRALDVSWTFLHLCVFYGACSVSSCACSVLWCL